MVENKSKTVVLDFLFLIKKQAITMMTCEIQNVSLLRKDSISVDRKKELVKLSLDPIVFI
jgi:hypothetical protein